MRVTGVSLHYYSEKENSDKYYRMWYFEDHAWPTGVWSLVQHWGRDGSAGQMRTSHFVDEQRANQHLLKKMADQIGKGYKLLGDGSFQADDSLSPQLVSRKVRDWLGTEMLKVPDGFEFVIREEPSIDDLLQCSDSSTPPPTDFADSPT